MTTSLVQTDVMVFDKQGKFIDNLPREQFVLKVDGKPRDIAFFERVQAGTSNEEAQLAAARGGPSTGTPVPLDRGRTIFFFIDDFHLSPVSLTHVRTMLTRFVDRNAGQNDRIAVVAASGQLGFLQQLTDNKAVLQRAIERLSTRVRTTKDFDQPPMTEYQARLVDRYDRDVTEYYIDELVKQGIPRATAEGMVRSRASVIMEQSAHISANTLQTLRHLSRSAADLPGRKLVFFISDGFLLNARDFVRQGVRDLTAQAARSGVVIYSIDARGLVATVSDPADPPAFDPSGRLNRSNGGESAEMQDGMFALAADTGGRALFNTNDLLNSVSTGLAETSKYYLLAWRPDSDDEKDNKARRLAVNINGRPDLVVRFRKQLAQSDESRKTKTEKPKIVTDTQALREALRADHPKTSLPVHVSANFLNLPDAGTVLVLSVKIATDKIPLETVNGSATSQIDLALAIFDETGKSVKTFSKTLNLRSVAGTTGEPPDFVVYRESPVVTPGLYQVRAAAVERKERRAGSTHEWIEVPNLGSKSLAMSSLIVGEQGVGAVSLDVSTKDVSQSDSPSVSNNLRLNIDRRFARDSHLRFLTFVYNAATAVPGGSGVAPGIEPARAVLPSAVPDLAIQLQVFRDDQPVITAAARKIRTEGVDLARVPYAADVSLEGLQPGSYILQATVIDRIAKATTAQRFKFQVD